MSTVDPLCVVIIPYLQCHDDVASIVEPYLVCIMLRFFLQILRQKDKRKKGNVAFPENGLRLSMAHSDCRDQECACGKGQRYKRQVLPRTSSVLTCFSVLYPLSSGHLGENQYQFVPASPSLFPFGFMFRTR